jgi:Flp pilus assembly pilin Flp
MRRLNDLRGDDRGAATVEYAGVMFVVVALVSALIVGSTPVGGTIMAKICEAFGASCAAPGSLDADGDRVPDHACTLQTDGTELEAGVEISFVNIGSSGEMTVERMSDGTYKVTLGGEAGAAAALSAGKLYGAFEVGDYGTSFGAQAQISAGVFGGAGTEYSFANKEQADDFTDWVTRTVAKEGVKAVGSSVVPGSAPAVGVGVDVVGWVVDKVTGYDYQPPSPDSSYFEGGITADASAAAGGLTAGGSASASYQDALGFRLDHKTGERTIYSKLQLDAEAAAQIGFSSTDGNWGAGGSGSGHVELIVSTTVDKDWNVTGLSVDGAATAEGAGSLTGIVGFPLQGGGGKGVQFSASAPVTDANRAQVLAALGGMGVTAVTSGAPPAMARGDAIMFIIDQARKDGDVTAQFLDVSSSNLVNAALGIEAPVIGGLGFSAGAGTTSTTSTGAHYLGADGWKDWTGCAA